jgi:hypothetical protein
MDLICQMIRGSPAISAATVPMGAARSCDGSLQTAQGRRRRRAAGDGVPQPYRRLVPLIRTGRDRSFQERAAALVSRLHPH